MATTRVFKGKVRHWVPEHREHTIGRDVCIGCSQVSPIFDGVGMSRLSVSGSLVDSETL